MVIIGEYVVTESEADEFAARVAELARGIRESYEQRLLRDARDQLLTLPSLPLSSVSCVYFIRGIDAIKIGTTLNLLRRFGELSIANPSIDVVGILLNGNRDDEQTLHRIFGDTRLAGEWFQPSASLLSWIDRANQDPSLMLDELAKIREYEWVPA